jgi:hypothetical protein
MQATATTPALSGEEGKVFLGPRQSLISDQAGPLEGNLITDQALVSCFQNGNSSASADAKKLCMLLAS